MSRSGGDGDLLNLADAFASELVVDAGAKEDREAIEAALKDEASTA